MILFRTFLNSPQNRIIAGILLLALFLRIPFLFESVWLDESLCTKITIGRFGYLLWWLISTPVTHAPAFFSSMYIWINIFGDSEVSIRIPPLLYGLGSILLVTKLSKHFDKEQLGILVALLLCFSPVHVWYSTEARPYSSGMFWLFLTLYLFLKSFDQPKNIRLLVGYSVSLTITYFSHLYLVVFSAAFLLLLFIRQHPARWKFLIGTLIPIILFASYYFFKESITPLTPARGHARAFTLFEAWMLFFNWYSLGNTIWTFPVFEVNDFSIASNPFLYLCQVILFVFFVKGIIKFLKARKAKERWLGQLSLLFLIALPLFLFCLNLLGYNRTYIERSTYVGLPFFFLFLIHGAQSFFKPKFSHVGIFFIFFMVLSSYSFLILKKNVHSVYQVNPDWRSGAQLLEDRFKKGEKLKILATLIPMPVLYYQTDLFSEWLREFRYDSHALLVKIQTRSPWLAPFLEKARLNIEHDLTQMKEPLIEVMKKGKINWARLQEGDFEKFYIFFSVLRPAGNQAIAKRASQYFHFEKKHSFRKINVYEFSRKD